MTKIIRKAGSYLVEIAIELLMLVFILAVTSLAALYGPKEWGLWNPLIAFIVTYLFCAMIYMKLKKRIKNRAENR